MILLKTKIIWIKVESIQSKQMSFHKVPWAYARYDSTDITVIIEW